jgi:uncharacterized protein YjbI with pentapeptide repeats
MSTSFPPELRRLIEAAAEALRLDPFRTVRPIDRRNIYLILGQLDDPEGRQRRVALDRAAACRVLPVWEEMWWGDGGLDSPRALLDRAERVLGGEPFDTEIYNEAFDTEFFLGAAEMVGRDVVGQERAGDAWRAAIATLRTAGGKDPFMALFIDGSTRDSDIDEESADAARWAAQAMSADTRGLDIRSLRDFWEWWLWEAVPSAWGGTPLYRTGTVFLGNSEQLAILEGGAEAWNAWRKEHPGEGVNFSGATLRGVQLQGAQLQFSNLRKIDLTEADLISANLVQADLAGADLPEAVLRAAFLEEAELAGADLRRADLSRARLSRAKIFGANLAGSRLRGAWLKNTILSRTVLREADLGHSHLDGADLSGANLFGADLSGARLTGANLRGALLRQAVLRHAKLKGADLRGADFSEAVLVGTDFCGADLTGCRVYGIAAWDVLYDDETKQDDLIITPVGEPRITIDNLEVAQFIYLLLHNDRIRNVIDTVAKKAVLILGRFGLERKVVLDALRDELRRRDYLPILFDFDVPKTRDITETVSLLARMARFIIADLTDPSSIPKELEAIVPSLAVPVQPLLEGLARPYVMFEDYWKYDWVLSPYRYEGLQPLLATIAERVITPAEAKVKSLEERRRAIEAELTASRTSA